MTNNCIQAEKTVPKGREVEMHMTEEDNGKDEDDGRGSGKVEVHMAEEDNGKDEDDGRGSGKVEMHMAEEDNGKDEDDGRGSENLTSAKDQQQPAKRKRQTVSCVGVDSSLTVKS